MCQCYMCCFEWDLREKPAAVLARARRRYQGERPSHGPEGEEPSEQP